MLLRRTTLQALALQTGSPVAVVSVHADGSVVMRWANEAMGRLLGCDPADAPRAALADLLGEDSGTRLTAAARDLVRLRGARASLQVTVLRPGEPGQVQLHLLAGPRTLLGHLRAARGGHPGIPAVLHAGEAPEPDPAGLTDGRCGDAELTERLSVALLRLRRHPARVAVALARVRLPAGTGLRRPTAQEFEDLAQRVRQAARQTDTVVQLDDGRLVVVAEDSADDGGMVVARRLLAVLHRPLGGESRPVVSVAVVEVADPDADPDAVLSALDSGARSGPAGGGLVVLSRTDGGGADREAAGPAGPGSGQQQIRAALESGRFILDCRPVPGPRGFGEPATARRTLGTAHQPAAVVLAEVGTVDVGVVSPVRVDAPGLAAALDRWAVARVGDLAPGDDVVVLQLQPGGALVSLREELTAVQQRRPGTRLVLAVPEARLDEAVSAQRAGLHELPALGVGLGVAGWTGRLDVRALVRWQVRVVQLSADWHRDVLLPEGAAMLAGLVAGLRAGLGEAALVVADPPGDARAEAALAACGVRWAGSAQPAAQGAA